MRKLILVFLAIAGIAMAQTAPALADANIFGFGPSWNQSASNELSQQFAGTGFYARAQTPAGTYAYVVGDFVPTAYKPFTVTNNIGAGIAQKAVTLGGFDVYVTGSIGPSWTGANTGWQWTAGGMALRKFGKSGWSVGPALRALTSNVSNKSGTQFIVSLVFSVAK